jgi:hypothetical protein
VNVFNELLVFVSSRLMSEILILISVPFLSAYSIYRVLVAVFNAGKPFELAISGFGGALWLLGYMLHGLEPFRSATEMDTAFWSAGVALMIVPKLIGMWRDHVRSGAP